MEDKIKYIRQLQKEKNKQNKYTDKIFYKYGINTNDRKKLKRSIRSAVILGLAIAELKEKNQFAMTQRMSDLMIQSFKFSESKKNNEKKMEQWEVAIRIRKLLSDYFDAEVADKKTSESRKTNFVAARQVGFYLCDKKCPMLTPVEIAPLFNRHRTTFYHSVEMVQNHIDRKDELVLGIIDYVEKGLLNG